MKKVKVWVWIASLFPWVLVIGVVNSIIAQNQRKHKMVKEMHIRSSAFEQNGVIPSKYTCDGINVSPALEWSGFPSGTKSFALVCDDPDASSGSFIHWVVFNIPATVMKLDEHFISGQVGAKGALSGNNSAGKTGYLGPCPPTGIHRYFFKIYALDMVLNEKEGISSHQLDKAMEGHILAKGDLMGKYSRK
jgi:Raf kinase inhibitor-like YbhB/YbcL family protein